MSITERVEKALYARLSASGTVQVLRAHLAADSGCSEASVDRAVRSLRNAGVLEIASGGHRGSASIYRMLRESASPAPEESASQEKRVTVSAGQKRVINDWGEVLAWYLSISGNGFLWPTPPGHDPHDGCLDDCWTIWRWKRLHGTSYRSAA